MTYYEQIQKLIDEANVLYTEKQITARDSKFITWKSKAEIIIGRIFGEESKQYNALKKRMFSEWPIMAGNYAGPSHADQVSACKEGLEKTIAELEAYKDVIVDDYENQSTCLTNEDDRSAIDMSKIFIIHGHDGELKQAVARLIEKQGLEAIILSEQANRGATIIEKIEKNSDVSAAICLFTPDDDGKGKNDTELKKRARQNVVFETGYFMGKLSRQNMIIIADPAVEMPSDLEGVVYTDKGWEIDVLKELNAMGFSVDLNVLVQ